MNRLWGPVEVGPDMWRLNLWAPAQHHPLAELEGREPVSLVRGEGGWFHADVPARPGARYRFRLDDGLAVPDPASRAQRGGVHGWSVITDLRQGAARSFDWKGRPWNEAAIMEVHVGLYGGFAGVAGDLPRLARLGITAIELMPINAFGGARNWGYDGVLPFAPVESYGTPDELRALIDRAHALGLMMLLDVVYNHFGPDGNYIAGYAPDFFHPDEATPWGGAVAVDQPAVAAYFRENALMWLLDYGFDGLRFDAVHAIGNVGFLDGLAADIRARAGDRPVHLILENEHNDSDRLAPGRYDAQWNDDFHNVLHVLLTGETSAYYGDFADRPTERLARCLAQGFIYQGEPSSNRDGRPRGTPSGHLPPTAFVAFLQNHDQVGNRALGERLTRLTDADRLRAATALLLLCPHIPLMFMGDEQGARSPFLFFTDFHDDLAEVVREGRRQEFAKFDAFGDEASRARIPDPNAPETFAASHVEGAPDAGAWEDLYRQLLALRARSVAPRLPGAVALGATVLGDKAVSARWRLGDGTVLTIAINLGSGNVHFPLSDEPLFALATAGAPASFAAWLRAA